MQSKKLSFICVREITRLVEAQECIIVRNNLNPNLMQLEVNATCIFCSASYWEMVSAAKLILKVELFRN